MWYILNSSNEVVGSADFAPDSDDLATRGETSMQYATENIAMKSVWNGVSFDPPTTPVATLADAQASKTRELSVTRQQKIAAALGTSVNNLANHEAHLLRIAAAANDAKAHPTEWHNRTLNGTVMGTDNAAIQAAADAILAAQRLFNDAVETVVAEYNAKINATAAATTVGEVDAITWA